MEKVIEIFNVKEKLPIATNDFLNETRVICWDADGRYLGVAVYLSKKHKSYINHCQLNGLKGFVQSGTDEDHWEIPAAYWAEIPHIEAQK